MSTRDCISYFRLYYWYSKNFSRKLFATLWAEHKFALMTVGNPTSQQHLILSCSASWAENIFGSTSQRFRNSRSRNFAIKYSNSWAKKIVEIDLLENSDLRLCTFGVKYSASWAERSFLYRLTRGFQPKIFRLKSQMPYQLTASC